MSDLARGMAELTARPVLSILVVAGLVAWMLSILYAAPVILALIEGGLQ